MSNQMLSPVVRIVDDDASVCESQSFFFSWQDLELDLSQAPKTF